MPRPGPRPYVCERRAWHSDRHQPIRGSLVQEIFRVVNEIHCSATKKNKEWQEKLPVVVLKAEEIMYSKANSEAEYMDLETLWDRTNDAINTIIRRDESTETGEFLQPCIEAALNLGCTARRTLRSERNCKPRCYLNPGSQEAENIAQGNLKANSHYTASYSGIMKPTSMNGSLPSNNQCLHIEKYPPNLYSVFPLFYGNHLRFEEQRHDFGIFPNLNSNMVVPATMGYIHNLSVKDVDSKNQHELACDLSLRLGPCSTPCPSVRNSQPWTPPSDRSFSSFLRSKDDDPLNPSSNEQRFESEHTSVDEAIRKRKTVYDPTVDRQFCLPSKLPCCHLSGRMKSAGS